MTDIEKLRKLLALVESATGPDLRIDRKIQDTFPDGELGAPYYTGSIDAAVELCERVLPGDGHMSGKYEDEKGTRCIAYVNKFEKHFYSAIAASPALALCAAILRAKIAMLEKETA